MRTRLAPQRVRKRPNVSFRLAETFGWEITSPVGRLPGRNRSIRANSASIVQRVIFPVRTRRPALHKRGPTFGRWIPVRANARLSNHRSRWSLAVLQTPKNRFSPIAPTARPSPKGRFSRRESAAPDPIGRGEAAGFSRRITESYDSRDSAPAKTINPQRVSVIAKITFLPNRVKRGLIVFLNAKPRFGFSGGPPVKTGGFPRAYGARGGAFAPGKSPVGRWTRHWRVGVSFA